MWRGAAFWLLAFTGSAVCAEQPRGILVRSGLYAESSLPFRAVGVYWQGASHSTVRVRASVDGRSWTPWMESNGEAIERDRMGSGLIYFDGVYRYAQVEGVPDPEILFINPGDAPAALAVPRKLNAAAPAIVPREQWGCTPQVCPAQDPPLYTTVTHLIVHHTAGANAATDWPAVLRSIWVLHVMGNGWNDIGYNYLIDPNGILYEGRAGGDGVLGAHFSGVNSGTMGVALLGTYIDVPPTPNMLATLSSMLAWQAEKWNLDPSGESPHAASGLMLNVISGHRDAGISPKATSTTECPGNSAYSGLPQIRNEVSARLNGSCPIEVGERNRCVAAAGASLIIAQTPARCTWGSTFGPTWISEVVSAATISVDVAPNPAARRSGAFSIGGHTVTVTQAAKGEPDLPCVGMRGVVSAANFDARPVVPGSQVSVFGDHLTAGDASQTAAFVNGKAVPIEFSNPGQINIQLPSGTPTGTAHLRVAVNGTQGPETNFWVTEAVPALFTQDGTRAIAVNEDGSINGPDHPVKAGNYLTVYLTGAAKNLPASATIGGQAAASRTLSLVASLVGVYQAEIDIPSNLPSGEHALVLNVSGVASREATVSVAGNNLLP